MHVHEVEHVHQCRMGMQGICCPDTDGMLGRARHWHSLPALCDAIWRPRYMLEPLDMLRQRTGPTTLY